MSDTGGDSRRDRDERWDDRARSRSPGSYQRRDDRTDRGPTRNLQERNSAAQHAAAEASRRSQKNCRVYVGNLAYSVTWNQLKDLMREAGDVKFSEILTMSNGRSKGCGIVEYGSPEDAENAIRTLHDRPFQGRPVLVREDREDTAHFGQSSARPFGRDGGDARLPPRGGSYGASQYGDRYSAAPPSHYGSASNGYADHYGARRPPAYTPPTYGPPPALYVGNLPFDVDWKELKDLFRIAGNIARADISTDADGRSRGFGTVVYRDQRDVANAIERYHGFSLRGRILEVRLDRFANNAMPASTYDAPMREVYDSGSRGQLSERMGVEPSYTNPPTQPRGTLPPSAQRSVQILVKNLPWATDNDDLVELFQTVGRVEHAEIELELGGRSKGSGVVQFHTTLDAEAAIARFQRYMYGGRPLDISFNPHWTNF